MKCPDCHQDVVEATGGRLLHPTKSRIGRYLPDGTEVTPDDTRNGVRAHTLHYCPPAALRTNHTTTTQQSLF